METCNLLRASLVIVLGPGQLEKEPSGALPPSPASPHLGTLTSPLLLRQAQASPSESLRANRRVTWAKRHAAVRWVIVQIFLHLGWGDVPHQPIVSWNAPDTPSLPNIRAEPSLP